MSVFSIGRRTLESKLILKKTFKKIPIIKGYQALSKVSNEILTDKPNVMKFNKGNCRKECHSSFPVEGVCGPIKTFPELAFLHVGHVEVEWYSPIEWYIPEVKQVSVHPFVVNWRWYTDVNKTSEGQGGILKEPGGRLGRLDSVNEGGFFHNNNKEKLEKIKKLMKDKSMLKGDTTPKNNSF